MPHTADPILGLYWNATKPFTELLNTCLTSAERLQNAQLSVIHDLMSNQSHLERQLTGAATLYEALDIQGKATRDGWTKAITAMSDVYAAGSINQMEWLRQTHGQTLQAVDSLENSMEALPGEAAPLTSLLKLSFGAIRATCMANMRAAEEATKFAVSKPESVVAETMPVASKRQAA